MIGEISSFVLDNFGIEVPCSGLELDVNELFNILKDIKA